LRELFDASNRRQLSAGVDKLDELIVWDARKIPVPDLQAVYYGLDGVSEFWRRWLPMWEHIQVEPVWIEAVGDRVLTWLRQIQTGKGSGVSVDVYYGWDVTFREGKIIRVSFFDDQAAALQTVASGP
jgi:ketosteroid isomerase-like protein